MNQNENRNRKPVINPRLNKNTGENNNQNNDQYNLNNYIPSQNNGGQNNGNYVNSQNNNSQNQNNSYNQDNNGQFGNNDYNQNNNQNFNNTNYYQNNNGNFGNNNYNQDNNQNFNNTNYYQNNNGNFGNNDYNQDNNQNFNNTNYYQNNNGNFGNNDYNQDNNQNFNNTNYYQNNNGNFGNNDYNQEEQPAVEPAYKEEPEKKKSIIPVIITAVVTFIVLVVGLYFGYNKFIKKENVADLSTYEVNFVTYGSEGEGKPEVDIKKVPTVAKSSSEISNFLSNPTISYDKQSNLKNGDKVEVTITLDQNTANKLNLKTTGEFKRSFTVNGLTEKAKDKETIIVKEGSSNNSNNSSSSSSSNSTIARNGEAKRIYVDAGVNLRSNPNDSSTILATAKKGDTVYVEYTQTTSNGETWAYLYYGGKYGWMRADLVGY